METDEISFKLGQLTAQISELSKSSEELKTLVFAMNEKISSVEKKVLVLSVKMALLGITSGWIGSQIVPYFFRRLFYAN